MAVRFAAEKPKGILAFTRKPSSRELPRSASPPSPLPTTTTSEGSLHFVMPPNTIISRYSPVSKFPHPKASTFFAYIHSIPTMNVLTGYLGNLEFERPNHLRLYRKLVLKVFLKRFGGKTVLLLLRMQRTTRVYSRFSRAKRGSTHGTIPTFWLFRFRDASKTCRRMFVVSWKTRIPIIAATIP